MCDFSIISAFKSQPLTPPSRAQELIRLGNEDPESDVDYLASIKRLMTNKGYVLLLVTYGLNVGVFYAISTLLNSVIMSHFEVSYITYRTCIRFTRGLYFIYVFETVGIF